MEGNAIEGNRNRREGNGRRIYFFLGGEDLRFFFFFTPLFSRHPYLSMFIVLSPTLLVNFFSLFIFYFHLIDSSHQRDFDQVEELDLTLFGLCFLVVSLCCLELG